MARSPSDSLQPLMGLIYAARDGIVDARQGRPPYFWSVLFTPASRGALLREGWKAEARVLGTIYPFELIVIVLALAFVPYVLARGPINRIARAWITRRVCT